MVVGDKVCDITDVFLWFVCGLYVGILTSPLIQDVTTTGVNISYYYHYKKQTKQGMSIFKWNE